ncbi:ATP-dependent exoDNAse (plasmid) [Nostoc flagelliforme CCNUN1]|uniref:ATP-dependent exoDNAse n=1 Tax=Nostoc flagelliforme CCNUN1 TaxID=2038116 RepID=A0A2K8TAD0_9NOSO|nr:DUF3854 domain-containing protein [Nostoc flagelliforme]AUB44622.1 ATP-dependent exoDNAse [Nostoc flagelliforme CCNUN1]
MFDERHLQLSSAYAKSSEYFARAVIAPYLKFVLDSIGLAIDDEINKRLKLSIGQEAYVMTPDENGGWKWQKFDPQTEEFSQAEFEEFEELLTELLTPLLPSSGEIPLLPPDNTDPLLPGSNTPPKLSPSDSPPLLPPSDTPPFLLNSATPVELVAIPIAQEADSIIWQGAESRGAQKQTSEEEICTSFFPPAQKPPSPVPLCTSAPLPLLTSRIDIDIDIDPNHWQELVEGSGIAPEIVELNFKSLHLDPIEFEHEAWEYLMYSPELERINTGRLSTGMLNKYSHLEDGGWWCNAGVDPRSFASLQPSQKPTEKIWGCYKPNNKREKLDNPGKFIKYEHPPKTGLSIFLLDVPINIARQIYESAGVEPSISDRTSGFWYCVWKHNVPVTLTEGAKKAASLLSQGEAAIGLPGIYAGYRSKDGLGNQIVPVLHDELAVFATSNRDIKICFDYETRYKTKRNINIATSRTGQLLSDAGAQVSVVELPGPEKGVDDLIVVQGVEACKQVLMASVPLDDWIKKNQPPDLRLTVFLKNGEQIHLYEQLGDGTVNLSPSRESVEEEQTIALFGKTRSKLSIIQPTDLITTPETSSQNIGAQVIDAEVLTDESKKEVAPAQNASLPLNEVSVDSFDSWARREQVKQYPQNFFRKRLEARENKEIASVAYALVKNYGVEKDGNLVYQADAFTIIKSGNNYSIHRRADETLALMQFSTDKWGAITLSEQPKDMFPIERQEFLLVADYLKSGKQLPSVDEDPRKIANTLGSLSFDGTHTILESFKTDEILQILTQTLKRTGCDDLQLGNYRILYQKSQLDTTSTLQLLKTEHTGVTRVAASFEFSRTDSGMTHQLKTLAITEQDIAKLRLLAQKLDIQQPAKEATANPHATRDIEVPIHPKIAKLWQDLENRQQKSNSVPYTAAQVEQNFLSPDSTFDLASNSQDINLQPTNTVVAKPIKKTSTSQHQLSKSDIESIPLPLHPLLGQYWQELEDNHRWADIAKQENAEFRLKIQSNGKLSIGEQRELYHKIQVQAQTEIRQQQRTNLVLPPLSEITHDLRQQINQQPDSQHLTDSCNSIRNTLLPVHPLIAKPWQDLETTGLWAGVAAQGNYPLQEKLKHTGKLTLGEQRELYHKLLIHSVVEQCRKGLSDISLPPLNEIIQDLMSARSEVIHNTYTPKVEVHSQKSQQSHHKAQSNSAENEL